MHILFTRNDSPVSRLIRSIIKEPVSHCAMLVNDYVIHFNFFGLRIESRQEFAKHSLVVHSVPVPYDGNKLLNMICQYRKSRYDFGGLLYLGLRYLLPGLPKANLWQTSGMFLCTEWITQYIRDEEDSLITPYKLYLRLSSEGDTK